MGRNLSCCCPSLIPSRETLRFYLLGFLIALYMLAGAAIFSSLERPAEIRAHGLWEGRLMKFSHEHNVSCDELKSLLLYYEEARTAGIRTERGRALWDVPGAFYFVGTVVSTIGFGVTAPSTMLGKVFLVFYGLLGCSAAILFFNLFLERAIALFRLLALRRPARRSRPSPPKDRKSERNIKEDWKPSVYRVTLLLFLAVVLVAGLAASLYSIMEGWTYLESLYFCFVAFSTVGFGDFVSSQRKHHEKTWAYQVANCLLMLLGVCCTYSLLNAISVIMRQGLNWVLNTLIWIHNCMQPHGLRSRSLLKHCFSDSGPSARPLEEETQRRKQLQTASCSSHSMLWRSCLPSAIGKCLCDEARVETICHKSKDEGDFTTEEQNDGPYMRNSVCTQSLPGWLSKNITLL